MTVKSPRLFSKKFDRNYATLLSGSRRIKTDFSFHMVLLPSGQQRGIHLLVQTSKAPRNQVKESETRTFTFPPTCQIKEINTPMHWQPAIMTQLTVLKPKNTLENKLTQRKSITSCHLSCSSSLLHFLVLITQISYLSVPSSYLHVYSLPLSYSLSVSLSLSLSLPLHFKRTNVSCSHCSTALVFCSQFSQEPGSGCCFKQPQSNPTQSAQKKGEKGLKN